MFDDAYPRDTLARTKSRLDRHGPVRWVLIANGFEWVSLALHHAVWRIVGATLALAIASRADLDLLRYVLLAPLAWYLLLLPLSRAIRMTHRQVELHRIAARVWSATPRADRADRADHADHADHAETDDATHDS